MSPSSPFRPHPSLAIWRPRLLLAVALLFGSQILLWTDPTRLPLIDWLALTVGYTATAALLLDLAVRFRIRNIFGVLALVGIYGLLNGLLLNPDTALADMPRTLFTRVMGAHTFAGLLMLGLFLQMSTPRKVSLPISLIAGGLVGLGWGTWARWSPTLLRPEAGDTPLGALLIAAVIAAGLFAALLAVRPRDPAPDLRLKPMEWLVVVVVFASLLAIRVINAQIDALSFTLIVALIVFCLALLWFLRRDKGRTLLDNVGTTAPRWTVFIIEVAAFVIMGIVSYGLPRGAGAGDPVFVITVVLTGFGLAWLPGVSLALGAQAFAREVRAGRL
jgi:hypothetical protein